jgi:hypothetical protein
MRGVKKNKVQKEVEILKRRKPSLYLGPPTIILPWLRSRIVV